MSREPAIPQDASPFFHDFLHDSWVHAIKRDSKEIVVTIENFAGHTFLEAVAQVFDCASWQQPWPTDLIFQDVTFARSAYADESGALRYWRPHVPPVDIHGDHGLEFMGGWFFGENNRLQWIAEFSEWASRKTLGHYLMVDCGSVTVVDRGLIQLERRCGKAAADFYRNCPDPKMGVGYNKMYVESLIKSGQMTRETFRVPWDCEE